MKGLLGQDSGGSDPRDESPDWLDDSRSALNQELSEVRGVAPSGPHQDVFILEDVEVGAFGAWVSPKARRASVQSDGSGDGYGSLAQRGEWPVAPVENNLDDEEGSAAVERLEVPSPLQHPLIEVATELRTLIDGLLGELKVAPMQKDEGAQLTEYSTCEGDFPVEAPLVQFSRGAALIQRSLSRCRALRLQQRDGVQQLRLAGYEALLGYRSLKASSDLMNDVRIAAYSLGKIS